jgi:hypothetical protein
MLRMRSRDAPEPPAADETMLTDMARVVADAQAEIARLVQLGELQNDPIRHPIQALSVHLDALYKVTQAGSQVLARQLQASPRPVDPRNQPLGKDELRRAVIQGVASYAGEAVRALNWRSGLVGTGVVLAALLGGAVAGYAVHDSRQLVAGVSAGQTECQDVNGGTLCRIPVWAKLPPVAAAR